MKKLLQGSIALLIFSISIMIFQTACKKEALADVTPTITFSQAGKLITYGSTSNTLVIENYDGTGAQTLNITLPQPYTIWGSIGAPAISPDHKTLFFPVANNSSTTNITAFFTYSCNIDGSNVQKVDNIGSSHTAF